MDNLNQNQFSGVSRTPLHFHNGVDSPTILIGNVKNFYTGFCNTASIDPSNFHTPFLPSGWSIAVNSDGYYTITHNLGTTAYTVLLTTTKRLSTDASTITTIMAENFTTTTVDIHIINIVTLAATNRPFSFIIIKNII